MFLRAFFGCIILCGFCVFLFFKKRQEEQSLYFEQLQTQGLENTQKSKRYCYLNMAQGCLLAKKSLCLKTRVLFPLKNVNVFVFKNYDFIKEIDKKINNCKLVFMKQNKKSDLENCAKYAINLQIYNKNCNVLQFLQNYKIINKLSNRKFKYLKFLTLEEIVVWINKLSTDLKQSQKFVLKAKKTQKGKVCTKLLNNGAYVYGLAKFNSNSMRVSLKHKLNIVKNVEQFFEELKTYEENLSKLFYCFNEIKSTL